MSSNETFKVLIIAAIAISGMSFFAVNTALSGDAASDSGICGNGLIYSLTGDILVIDSNGMGSGAMYDFEAGTAPWYEKRSNITSIDFRSEIVSIGSYAFYGCDSVLLLSPIPDTVFSIGDHAFSGCTMVSGELSISKNVSFIGECAFSASGFSGITVSPENEYYMSENGILFNKEQTEIIQATLGNYSEGYVIPSTVTKVWPEAFYHGKGMVGVLTVPASVVSIGDRAFSASAFTAIQVDLENSMYMSKEGILYSKDGTRLIQVPTTYIVDGFTVPSEVRSISDCAFLGCFGFTGILDLGDNLRSIGARAFESCTGFSIVIFGKISGINEAAFSGWGFYHADGTPIQSVNDLPRHMFSGTYDHMVESSAPSSFTISYDANGGSGSVPSASSVYPSTVYAVKFSPAPSKEEVQFMGWSESSASISATYTETGTDSFVVTKDTVLYAVYSVKATCYVKYDANGGTGDVPESSSVPGGTEYKVEFTPQPSKEDHTFRGWSESPLAEAPSYTVSGQNVFTIAGDVILYAVYSKNVAQCFISFDSNGGSSAPPASYKTDYGSRITLPGYGGIKGELEFNGWSFSGSTYAAGSTILVTQDMDFKAVWAEKGESHITLYLSIAIAALILVIAAIYVVTMKKRM